MMPLGSTFRTVLAAAGRAVAAIAEAIDWDGSNDYLSKSSDLTGNADGKTLTFSAWVYIDNVSAIRTIYEIDGDSFFININTAGKMDLFAKNTSGTIILNAQTTNSFPLNTWIHILISVDLADSGNRAVYWNDESQAVTWSTYTNNEIDFTKSDLRVGESIAGGEKIDGRLAHVFLDYTFRDLTTAANRRNFITADLKPASGQADLNPILYFPMDDPATVATNQGTGGNFTLNGTVARSGRGPNQYNAAASTLDGSADYLSRTSLSGVSDSATMTLAFVAKRDSSSAGDGWILSFGDGSGISGLRFFARMLSNSKFDLLAENSASATVLQVTIEAPELIKDAYNSIVISLDLSDVNKRYVQVNGVDATSVTWATYSDDLIDFTTASVKIGRHDYIAQDYFPGQLSEIYFDTTYIDLSASNPFYDSATGKPKNLGTDGSTPTGNQPLIYLPLRGDDAGSNKGSGGDFTVNSGPFTGARGPSEFWAESGAFVAASSQYLEKSGTLNGLSPNKQFTFVASVFFDTSANGLIEFYDTVDTLSKFEIFTETASDNWSIRAQNTGPTTILDASGSSALTTGQWLNILISIDLSDSAKRHVFVDGNTESLSWTTYTDQQIGFDDVDRTRIAKLVGSAYDGKIGFLWFNTEYIDFSQEANRLKFFDAFNFPVDLGSDGSKPTGNVPLIYMNKGFHNGTNLGSGGNFTPQNTPTDGGFVKG